MNNIYSPSRGDLRKLYPIDMGGVIPGQHIKVPNLEEHLLMHFHYITQPNTTVHVNIPQDVPVVKIPFPNYIQKIWDLLLNTDARIIANYMGWMHISEKVQYACKADMQPEDNEMCQMRGANPKPRWVMCLEMVGFSQKKKAKEISYALSSMYVRTYFNAKTKAVVKEVAKSVRSAFRESINEANWMSHKTQIYALKKLDYMREILGYADVLLNASFMNDHFKGSR